MAIRTAQEYLALSAAMTDPKGDRTKRPMEPGRRDEHAELLDEFQRIEQEPRRCLP